MIRLELLEPEDIEQLKAGKTIPLEGTRITTVLGYISRRGYASPASLGLGDTEFTHRVPGAETSHEVSSIAKAAAAPPRRRKHNGIPAAKRKWRPEGYTCQICSTRSHKRVHFKTGYEKALHMSTVHRHDGTVSNYKLRKQQKEQKEVRTNEAQATA